MTFSLFNDSRENYELFSLYSIVMALLLRAIIASQHTISSFHQPVATHSNNSWNFKQIVSIVEHLLFGHEPEAINLSEQENSI